MTMFTRAPAVIAAAIGAALLASTQAGAQTEQSTLSATLLYEHARFGAELEPWHIVTGAVEHRGATLAAVLGATAARRFGRTGQQVELQLYPRFGRAGYGALSAAHSASIIFPRWRVSAELFRSLGGGFEASLGSRYMKFDTVDVTLLTGSIGRYVPHWYLSARPTLVPRDGEVLFSGDLLLRRYQGDAGHHLTIRLGAGETPAENSAAADLERQQSLRAGLDGREDLPWAWDLLWSAAWERESFTAQPRRTRLQAGLGLTYRF